MHGPPHESPWVVTVPLILLAILRSSSARSPSVPCSTATGSPAPSPVGRHGALAKEFHGAGAMMVHALGTLPFWLAIGGVALAWFLYIKRPTCRR